MLEEHKIKLPIDVVLFPKNPSIEEMDIFHIQIKNIFLTGTRGIKNRWI